VEGADGTIKPSRRRVPPRRKLIKKVTDSRGNAGYTAVDPVPYRKKEIRRSRVGKFGKKTRDKLRWEEKR